MKPNVKECVLGEPQDYLNFSNEKSPLQALPQELTRIPRTILLEKIVCE